MVAAPPPALVVHVAGPASSRSTNACFLELRSKIVGGGTMTYCLKTFTGAPGPNATVRDRGTMTFALRGGAIRVRVSVVQRFAADGAHARQSLIGTIVGGAGVWTGARGSVSGGGTNLERPRGQIAASDLRYRIVFLPWLVVKPASAAPGASVVVSGNAGSCLRGDAVTLISRAFPGPGFAGVGAVAATVGTAGAFSAVVRIPHGIARGRYDVTARCGGGNLGVRAVLRVV